MDSLRQLSMKFLEREELANYNFQNEFMKPFVVVMRKSGAVEIRELIIRCVSQMVLSRVDNVKSGWKSMFMIFTTAAHDAHKNIVFLSFEMVEKIIRDYFPHITETETTTFTDCVNCLVAFTNSKFEKDISLQAIAFLQYCARKLAEGSVGSSLRRNPPSSPPGGKSGKQDSGKFLESDEHLYSWFPLLA
ncbi:PREDICTED: brefeldin A-inhibited guanine nucleotide-exchange protein 3-like, partial [Camelina sativa]